MITRRCCHCQYEYGFIKHQKDNFTNGFCEICLKWIRRRNRWLRELGKNPKDKRLQKMVAIAEKVLTARKYKQRRLFTGRQTVAEIRKEHQKKRLTVEEILAKNKRGLSASESR